MNNAEKIDYDETIALMSVISQFEAVGCDATFLRQQLDCQLKMKPVRYDLTQIDVKGTVPPKQS